jgi:hypothetical protein
MCRDELSRIYEIRDVAVSSGAPDAYLGRLGDASEEHPLALKHLRDWEKELQGLDDAAWSHLKGKIRPLIVGRLPGRGWQPLFDKLNEAKAYNYLLREGCTNVHFVPEQPKGGLRTPDLEGDSPDNKVLCEVKTINTSDKEIKRRRDSSVFSISNKIDLRVLAKLDKNIAEARDQMCSYDVSGVARHVVYVVVNFDDHLHSYAHEYRDQIAQHIDAHPVSGVEIYLDIKPPFYSAIA